MAAYKVMCVDVSTCRGIASTHRGSKVELSDIVRSLLRRAVIDRPDYKHHPTILLIIRME